MWIIGGLIWSGVLVYWDLRHRRLPDWLTLPAAAVSLLWLPENAAGLVWPLLYLLVGLRSGGVGGGDIKLAVPLGIAVHALAGFFWVLAAVVGASLVTAAVARRQADGAAAHGPSMLAAAWAAAAVGA